MRKYLITIFVLSLSLPARGNLVSGSYKEGDWCYSDCTYQGCPSVRRFSCGGYCNMYEMPDWPICNSYNEDESCVIWKSSTEMYYCSLGGEHACYEIISYGSSKYETYNTTNHSVKYSEIQFEPDDNYYDNCSIEDIIEVSYGCAAGYYVSSGYGSNIYCSPCPNGGTSYIGNISQSNCYLPAGNFSDATGTGQYTSNCYW